MKKLELKQIIKEEIKNVLKDKYPTYLNDVLNFMWNNWGENISKDNIDNTSTISRILIKQGLNQNLVDYHSHWIWDYINSHPEVLVKPKSPLNKKSSNLFSKIKDKLI